MKEIFRKLLLTLLLITIMCLSSFALADEEHPDPRKTPVPSAVSGINIIDKA